MQRDKIDFGSMKAGQLFCKQLFLTLLGMVFAALFVITDGVFVGRGIGSNALAAVYNRSFPGTNRVTIYHQSRERGMAYSHVRYILFLDMLPILWNQYHRDRLLHEH